MSAFGRTAGMAALCAALMLNAGCQGDGGAQPLPPDDSSSTTPTEAGSGSPSPTEPTEPAWQDKYSNKEIAAYETALERFETYDQRSEPIWRRGKATPAAEELLKKYFFNWQSQFATLKRYERADVEIHGTPTVLASKPTRIALTKREGESVTIRQCIDYSTSQLLQNGEQAPGAPKSPRVRVVDLSRFVGANETPWRITAINTFEGKRRC